MLTKWAWQLLYKGRFISVQQTDNFQPTKQSLANTTGSRTESTFAHRRWIWCHRHLPESICHLQNEKLVGGIMLQMTIWLAGCDVSEKNKLLLQSTSNMCFFFFLFSLLWVETNQFFSSGWVKLGCESHRKPSWWKRLLCDVGSNKPVL